MSAFSLTFFKSFNLFMYLILFCKMRKYFHCITKNCEDITIITVMASAYC